MKILLDLLQPKGQGNIDLLKQLNYESSYLFNEIDLEACLHFITGLSKETQVEVNERSKLELNEKKGPEVSTSTKISKKKLIEKPMDEAISKGKSRLITKYDLKIEELSEQKGEAEGIFFMILDEMIGSEKTDYVPIQTMKSILILEESEELLIKVCE